MAAAQLLNTLLKKADLRLVRNSSYEKNCRVAALQDAHKLAAYIAPELRERFFQTITHSKAQIAQDLFVLSELSFKQNGYFVEFGATNGVDCSNSYLLEKHFGWHGILAEPAKKWHADLNKNRSAHIEKECVWRSSNEILRFNETHVGGLSTIDAFSNTDNHTKARQKGIKYDVKTISLLDLLDKYHAPRVIDYLSIDTEGSEFDILSAFDFSRYRFNIITCEHNFTPNREKIYALLTQNGYERKFPHLSQYDDWYVLANKNS